MSTMTRLGLRPSLSSSASLSTGGGVPGDGGGIVFNAFSPIKQKLRAGQSVKVWINADSTGYSDYGPFYKTPVAIGDLYDSNVDIYRWAEWDGAAPTGPKQYASVNRIRNGSGPTITVYLAALPGGVSGQMFDGSRRAAAIDAVSTPDLIIWHQGHNQQSFAQAYTGELLQGRATFLGPLGMIGLKWPNVPIAITTQNPWRDNASYDKVYAAIQSLAAPMPDMTIIDTYADFIAAGKATSLYRDNIHPSDTSGNSAGAQMVADRLVATWKQALSGAFTTTAWAKRVATPLVANGDFSIWPSPPAAPTGWTKPAGASTTKDVVNVFNGAPYSASFLLDATVQGQFQQFQKPLTAGERTSVAGTIVTLAILAQQPSGQTRGFYGFQARSPRPDTGVSLTNLVSGDLINCYDAWMLHCISGFVVDASASSDVNTSIRCSPCFNTAVGLAPNPVQFQKAWLVAGEVPALGL